MLFVSLLFLLSSPNILLSLLFFFLICEYRMTHVFPGNH